MSKKSKSTTGPSKWARPFIQRGVNALNDEYANSIGGLRETAGEFSGLIGDFARDRLENGNAGVNAAQDYGLRTLNGDYLTQNNPYFQDMLNNTLNASTNSTQAALGLRGLTGGSDYAGIIADRNARAATSLAYNDYGRERAMQEAAAGRAGSLAAAEYLPIQGLLSSLQVQQVPFNVASQYAGGIGGLMGGYTTTTSQRSPWEYISQAASNAATAAAASERRVKRDIKQLGTLSDGLGVYQFRYDWDADDAPLTYGVMVDEVAVLRPWALGPIVNGIQTVDYSKIKEHA